MKQEQIKKLEKLSYLVKEYKDKLQLLNNDKILSNGYYRDYFIVNNTTKNRPSFNFGGLIIMICVFLIPALGILNKIDIASILFLLAFLVGTVILIVIYKKNIKHWNIIKFKYDKDIQENKKRVEDLLNQMQKYKSFMLGVDLLEVDDILMILKLDEVKCLSDAVLIYNNQKNNINKQDKTVSDLTSIIINQQKLELERVNLEYIKATNTQRRLKCKYCGTLNNQNNSKCENCGGLLNNENIN